MQLVNVFLALLTIAAAVPTHDTPEPECPEKESRCGRQCFLNTSPGVCVGGVYQCSLSGYTLRGNSCVANCGQNDAAEIMDMTCAYTSSDDPSGMMCALAVHRHARDCALPLPAPISWNRQLAKSARKFAQEKVGQLLRQTRPDTCTWRPDAQTEACRSHRPPTQAAHCPVDGTATHGEWENVLWATSLLAQPFFIAAKDWYTEKITKEFDQAHYLAMIDSTSVGCGFKVKGGCQDLVCRYT